MILGAIELSQNGKENGKRDQGETIMGEEEVRDVISSGS